MQLVGILITTTSVYKTLIWTDQGLRFQQQADTNKGMRLIDIDGQGGDDEID